MQRGTKPLSSPCFFVFSFLAVRQIYHESRSTQTLPQHLLQSLPEYRKFLPKRTIYILLFFILCIHLCIWSRFVLDCSAYCFSNSKTRKEILSIFYTHKGKYPFLWTEFPDYINKAIVTGDQNRCLSFENDLQVAWVINS